MCRDLPAGHSQARSVGVPICDNERHKEISKVEERGQTLLHVLGSDGS